MRTCKLGFGVHGARWIVAAGMSVVLIPVTHAASVSWTPEVPSHQDPVTITIQGAERGGILHWGLNKVGQRWESAVPEYQPAGSEPWDTATRTRLAGPDESGDYSVVLGPFNQPGQYVKSIHFAINWDDGSWDNNEGKDYEIEVRSRRITFEPEAPTYREPVRIRVRDALPGGHLHWGVNEEESGNWRQVHERYWPPETVRKGSAHAVETPLPPPGEDGVSELVLGPFDAVEQVVTTLHAVVRWDSTWESDAGRNFNVSIRLPEKAPYLELDGLDAWQTVNDAFTVTARQAAATADRVPVTLWVNEHPLAVLPPGTAVCRVDPSNLTYGAQALVAACAVSGRTERVHRNFWYYPVVETNRTPVGIRLGAHETREGTIRFAIHAPGKRFVSVIGSFNHWEPEADIMYHSPNGTWWCEMELEPGEHVYQYLVDGHLRIADPYSQDVEWKEMSGQETWKPDRALSVLHVGQPDYAWNDHAYRRPALGELIIYEFYLEDLVPGGGFAGAIEKLDYIKALGATAIEMLPITEFASDHSWGYNPAFHFAPETAYGTPEEFKRLVDEAHQRGLAVIFDVVLNHMDWKSPLFVLYGDDYETSPYFHLFEGDNWGFPDVEQQSDAVKNYAADMIGFWINEYHIDGFRYDATRWVGWSGEKDWGASWFAYAGKLEDPDSYHIAEHLPPDPQLMVTSKMDCNWDSEFRWRIREMLTQARLDSKAFIHVIDPFLAGYREPTDRLLYLESHDEERMMRDLRHAGFSDEEVVRRIEAGHALLTTCPGVIMLYAGQEFGESTAKVVGRNPLHWENLDDPQLRGIGDSLRRLIDLRKTSRALQEGAIQLLVIDEAKAVAVYQRTSKTDAVVVAVNLGRDVQQVRLGLEHEWAWRNVLRDDSAIMSLQGGVLNEALPPGGALVLHGSPRLAAAP